MTLADIIQCKYQQAAGSIQKAYKRGYNTAQARYDQRKSIKLHGEGYVPKHYDGKLDKELHTLYINYRWQLKGIQECLDYLEELPDTVLSKETKQIIHERVGNILELLEEGTSET